MADKQAPFSEMDEEEFHITDDDIDHELDGLDDDLAAQDPMADPAENSSHPEKKKNRRFFKNLFADRKRLVIALIIVFAIVYAVTKLFSAKHQSMNNIQPVSHPVSTQSVATEPRENMLANVHTTVDTSVKPAPAPVTTTTNTASSATVEPIIPLVTPAATAQPQAAISSISEQPASPAADHAMIQQLQTLQQDNQILANKLAEVSAQLIQVASAMNNLNNKVDNIAKQPAVSATVDVKPLPKLIKDQHYYVEAVVPGRAWLQTDHGETITVTVGEEITGLGNVVSIEPATGDVVTTSGEIIKYGPY